MAHTISASLTEPGAVATALNSYEHSAALEQTQHVVTLTKFSILAFSSQRRSTGLFSDHDAG